MARVEQDRVIVRAAIHPAIGVARLGNSNDEYLIGPETVAAPPPGTRFRDASGALKRQAARFRIYGFNAAGEVVRELTGDDADVRWHVHVANHKASWYNWQMALDVPEAEGIVLPRRNPTVTGPDRATLTIDGGAVTIAGCNTSGTAYAFNGQFMGVAVYLGELRTDEAGRLLFLAGRGVSATPNGSPIFDPNVDNSFINAPGWYDDTCDGPVSAEVVIDGQNIPVDPAWVLTAPPDYAPGLEGVRTLYDLLFDLFVSAGQLSFPTTVSFYDHVYPLLRRLSGLQWVNQGFAAQFGWGAPHDFADPAFIARLCWQPQQGEYDREAELRRQVLNAFRPPEPTDNNALPWPWIYGDAMNVPPADNPRQNAVISATQYRCLQAWAAGQFTVSDPPERDHDLTNVPLAVQPAMLDRAALEYCLADAFHPGCEVTWPMRHITMYASPFRIRQRPADTPDPDYGDTLTPEVALSDTGPLHEQGPGDLTRWMGLPWQADTAFCRSGYSSDYDPYIPTFWPARVPNQVLTEDAYAIVVNPALPLPQRLDAFTNRALWTRAIDAPDKITANRMLRMVSDFGEMGLVEPRPGPKGDAHFPAVMMVEYTGVEPTPRPKLAKVAAKATLHPEQALHEIALAEAGASAEEIGRWPLPVQHPKSRK